MALLKKPLLSQYILSMSLFSLIEQRNGTIRRPIFHYCLLSSNFGSLLEHSLEREAGNVENGNSFPNCGDLDDIVLYTVFVDVKSAELQPTTRQCKFSSTYLASSAGLTTSCPFFSTTNDGFSITRVNYSQSKTLANKGISVNRKNTVLRMESRHAPLSFPNKPLRKR